MFFRVALNVGVTENEAFGLKSFGVLEFYMNLTE